MPEQNSAVATSPRWMWALCFGLLCASLLRFGCSLDRYPLPYDDDPYFNSPAVNYICGLGFQYPALANAPNADQFWAFGFPFHPYLQVLTFSTFGIGHAAMRWPQYLGAHLAIGMLLVFLLRNNLPKSAVLLALIWLGDRPAVEILMGRVDGLFLLSLVLGWLCLVQTCHSRSAGWPFLSGLCFSTAMGFHPTAPHLVLPLALLHLSRIERSRRVHVFGWNLAGAVPPGLLFFWLWTPDFLGHIEQFFWLLRQWHHGGGKAQGYSHMFQLFAGRMNWSRWWLLFLAGSALVVLAPVAWRAAWARHRPDPASPRQTALFYAAVMAVTAVVVLLLTKRFHYSYTTVYWTVWPVLALLILWETHPYTSRSRRFAAALLMIGALTWIPSLAWNTTRFREMFINYRALEQGPFERKLAELVPAGKPVTGTPTLHIPAVRAGLQFEPAPWGDFQIEAAPAAWIVLTEHDQQKERIAAHNLAQRQLVYQGDAFPRATTAGLRYQFFVYSPIRTLGASTAP